MASLRISILAAPALALLILPACAAPPKGAVAEGSSGQRLTPASSPVPADHLTRRVYVAVYSSIYLGLAKDEMMVNLAATVSVRNVSLDHGITLTHARYYDSAGKAVRDYVTTPSTLAPMATVEFVVKRDDTAGGPGANFVIEWSGPSDVDDPLVEAVMIGQSGHAAYSFTSVGRAVKNRSPER